MITITNNSIILPQGETAVVSFKFKDIKTNSPLILSDTTVTHSIHVVIKDHVSNSGDAILAKYISVENSEENLGWHIFTTSELLLIELQDDELQIGNVSDTISELITIPETLYKIVCKSSKNETRWIVYAYKNDKEELNYYDYTNSSITVLFSRNDTKDLQPKTYYLEIYHEARKPGLDPIKNTLLAPVDFIIKGALS